MIKWVYTEQTRVIVTYKINKQCKWVMAGPFLCLPCLRGSWIYYQHSLIHRLLLLRKWHFRIWTVDHSGDCRSVECCMGKAIARAWNYIPLNKVSQLNQTTREIINMFCYPGPSTKTQPVWMLSLLRAGCSRYGNHDMYCRILTLLVVILWLIINQTSVTLCWTELKQFNDILQVFWCKNISWVEQWLLMPVEFEDYLEIVINLISPPCVWRFRYVI